MQLEDLELWRKFLRKAADGISINKLVCRWPTRIVRVNACPQGMGGYCLESGIAWRYLLPDSYRNNRPDQADICPVRTLAELVARI
jgi:hypothetical protein